MSFEGYYQCICENGHLFNVDAMDELICPKCGEKAGFANIVDQTNDPDYGIILDWSSFKTSFGYRIPTEKEADSLRMMLIGDKYYSCLQVAEKMIPFAKKINAMDGFIPDCYINNALKKIANELVGLSYEDGQNLIETIETCSWSD